MTFISLRPTRTPSRAWPSINWTRPKASWPAFTSAPCTKTRASARKLIAFVETKARELGWTELITLSTQAFTYFQSKGGFLEGTPEDLPPSRREKYEQSGRNSKILIKKLTPK